MITNTEELEIQIKHLQNEVNVLQSEINSLKSVYLEEFSNLSESIQKSQKFIEVLINNIPVPIFVKTEEHVFIMVNDSLCSVFNITRDQIIGKTEYSFFDPDIVEKHWSQDDLILDSGQMLSIDEILKYPDGIKHNIITKKSRALHPETGHYLIIGAIHDVTESKQIEIELVKAKNIAEEANNAKSDFLSNMSHELRTPISIIFGLLQLLEITRLDDVQKQYITEMQYSCTHLLSLITDILDLTKIENGRIDISQNTFSIAQLMNEIKEQYMAFLKEKKLGFVCNISHDVPDIIISDPIRVKQILYNIIGNAIKFTDRGEILVEVGMQRHQLYFTISDTGIGIKSELQDKIFEKFIQGNNTFTKSSQGSGLGLSISKKLVELLGGNIWVESQEGLYSAFHFTIDIGYNLQATDFIPKKLKGPCCPLIPKEYTILVAEDHELGRKILNTMLSSEGFNIIEAKDGKDALLKLLYNHIDLAIIDIQMPVLDGLQVIKRIRGGYVPNVSNTIPIIALTAYAMLGDQQKILDAGANDYISKPFRRDILIRVVNNIISQNVCDIKTIEGV